MHLHRSSLVSVIFGSKESPMTFKNIIQRMPIKEFVEKFTKKCFVGIVLSVCSLLLWKPVQAFAADRTVANLVLMVDFENDTTKFATKYMGCEQIYTDTSYSGVHAYIRAISDGVSHTSPSAPGVTVTVLYSIVIVPVALSPVVAILFGY